MLELEWVGGVRVGAILQRDYYKRTCFASAVDVLPMLERRIR